MTLAGRLISLFPLTHGALIVAALCWLVTSPSPLGVLALLGATYLLPLLVFRLHNLVSPLKEGLSKLNEGYSSWYGGHQIQLLFITFPDIERPLRLVPGLFSLWLRAWGSDIGRGVYWTPHVEIIDRGLLVVGDGVVIGHKTEVSSHVVSRSKRGGYILFVKRVTLGEGAFIGAAARMGPGVEIGPGVLLRAGSDLYPKTKVME